MVITNNTPYTKSEIFKLKEQFNTYIKTVIDINKKVCSAGADRHSDSERILLNRGSQQTNIWGGGIDLETKEIDCNSFINIRPQDNNTSNEIQNAKIRDKYKKLTAYFFKEVL